MWDRSVLAEIARLTVDEGTFATFTAAGHVRHDLEAVGFEVNKYPGFGHKREMIYGRRISRG